MLMNWGLTVDTYDHHIFISCQCSDTCSVLSVLKSRTYFTQVHLTRRWMAGGWTWSFHPSCLQSPWQPCSECSCPSGWRPRQRIFDSEWLLLQNVMSGAAQPTLNRDKRVMWASTKASARAAMKPWAYIWPSKSVSFISDEETLQNTVTDDRQAWHIFAFSSWWTTVKSTS